MWNLQDSSQEDMITRDLPQNETTIEQTTDLVSISVVLEGLE